MKRFKFYAIFIAMVTLVACSDDFVPELTTNLETNSYKFTSEGGEQTFLLESNEQWSVGEVPDWIKVVVEDAPDTRATSASYESGKKAVTIAVEANPDYEERTAELKIMSVSGKMVQLTIVQAKKPELVGYWILSEGFSGQGNAELAWYDIAEDKVSEKQYAARNNGSPLGDTGNALEIYGSKMYVVVTGAGFTTETTEENSYIEVINPIDGKSIKRIPFKDAQGIPAKPRSIIFEGGYGYVSSYSNEVVRLDTATLTLDKHATLSGIMAEGLTFNNGNIYVCNGGQGNDSTISVVDIKEMKETKAIKTVKNPSHIVAASNGDIYFNTDWPEYKLYKLTIADEKTIEMTGLSVADMTYSSNNIYTLYSEWGNPNGEINEFDIETSTATKLDLDLEGSEYHIGTINGSNNIFITGAEDEVVIFNPTTKEIKHTFKTGTPGGSGVVAVYN